MEKLTLQNTCKKRIQSKLQEARGTMSKIITKSKNYYNHKLALVKLCKT